MERRIDPETQRALDAYLESQRTAAGQQRTSPYSLQATPEKPERRSFLGRVKAPVKAGIRAVGGALSWWGRKVGGTTELAVSPVMDDLIRWRFGEAAADTYKQQRAGVAAQFEKDRSERGLLSAVWSQLDSWSQVRRERPGMFFHEKLILEVLVDPTTYMGWGLASKAPGLLGRYLGFVMDVIPAKVANLLIGRPAAALRGGALFGASKLGTLVAGRSIEAEGIQAGKVVEAWSKRLMGEKRYLTGDVSATNDLVADMRTLALADLVPENVTAFQELLMRADQTARMYPSDVASFGDFQQFVQRIAKREEVGPEDIGKFVDHLTGLPPEEAVERLSRYAQRSKTDELLDAQRQWLRGNSAAGRVLGHVLDAGDSHWFRTKILRWGVFEPARAILVFANYGPMNYVEDVIRSVFGGHRPTSLNPELFNEIMVGHTIPGQLAAAGSNASEGGQLAISLAGKVRAQEIPALLDIPGVRWPARLAQGVTNYFQTLAGNVRRGYFLKSYEYELYRLARVSGQLTHLRPVLHALRTLPAGDPNIVGPIARQVNAYVLRGRFDLIPTVIDQWNYHRGMATLGESLKYGQSLDPATRAHIIEKVRADGVDWLYDQAKVDAFAGEMRDQALGVLRVAPDRILARLNHFLLDFEDAVSRASPRQFTEDAIQRVLDVDMEMLRAVNEQVAQLGDVFPILAQPLRGAERGAEYGIQTQKMRELTEETAKGVVASEEAAELAARSIRGAEYESFRESLKGVTDPRALGKFPGIEGEQTPMEALLEWSEQGYFGDLKMFRSGKHVVIADTSIITDKFPEGFPVVEFGTQQDATRFVSSLKPIAEDISPLRERLRVLREALADAGTGGDVDPLLALLKERGEAIIPFTFRTLESHINYLKSLIPSLKVSGKATARAEKALGEFERHFDGFKKGFSGYWRGHTKLTKEFFPHDKGFGEWRPLFREITQARGNVAQLKSLIDELPPEYRKDVARRLSDPKYLRGDVSKALVDVPPEAAEIAQKISEVWPRWNKIVELIEKLPPKMKEVLERGAQPGLVRPGIVVAPAYRARSLFGAVGSPTDGTPMNIYDALLWADTPAKLKALDGELQRVLNLSWNEANTEAAKKFRGGWHQAFEEYRRALGAVPKEGIAQNAADLQGEMANAAAAFYQTAKEKLLTMGEVQALSTGQLYMEEVDTVIREMAAYVRRFPQSVDTTKAWLHDVQEMAERLRAQNPELVPHLQANSVEANRLATERYKNTFTNYDDPSVVDQMMKMVYPFWQYQSRSWPWLLATSISHPGFFVAFGPQGRYWQNTEEGYLKGTLGALQLMPIRGTVFGRLRRTFRGDFPPTLTGWAGYVESASETSEWLGFFPGVGLATATEAAFSMLGGTGGGEAALSAVVEGLPPVMSSILDGAIAAGNDKFTLALSEKLAPSKFRNYYMAKMLWDARRVSPSKAREMGHEDWIAEAYRAVALRMMVEEQISLTRLQPESWAATLKELDSVGAQELGISVEEIKERRNAARMEGKRLSEVFPMSRVQRSRMGMIEGIEALSEAGRFLSDADRRSFQQVYADYFDTLDTVTKDLVRTQELEDSLWQAGFLTEKQWREGVYGRSAERKQLAENFLKSLTFGAIGKTPLERQALLERFHMAPSLIHPVDAAIDQMFSMTPPYDLVTQEYDWGAFYKAQDEILGELPDDERREVEDYLSRHQTPLVREFRAGARISAPYWSWESGLVKMYRSFGMSRYAAYLEENVKTARMLQVQAQSDYARGISSGAARLEQMRRISYILGREKEVYRNWLLTDPKAPGYAPEMAPYLTRFFGVAKLRA